MAQRENRNFRGKRRHSGDVLPYAAAVLMSDCFLLIFCNFLLTIPLFIMYNQHLPDRCVREYCLSTTSGASPMLSINLKGVHFNASYLPAQEAPAQERAWLPQENEDR